MSSVHGPLLIGPARDLILNYIKANINALIQDTNDYKRTDGINIEPIDSDAFYISEKFLLSLSPPAVYVLKDGPMKFSYQGAPNALEASDRFMVIVSAQDVGADVLEQKCETYGQILFTLLDQQKLVTEDGRLMVQLVINDMDFSDLMAKQAGETGEIYRRDVILRLTALHFEARTTIS